MSRLIKHIIRIFTYVFLRAKKTNEEDMKGIWRSAKVCCVLCASGIGDSLMATPLIEEIKRLRPAMRLIAISSTSTKQVFETNPKIDKILNYDSNSVINLISMIKKLRAENIDIFFASQPSNTIKHSLIAAYSKAKSKLKHDYDYGTSYERDYSFVYNQLLPDSMERHRVELNLDFLRFFGETIKEKSSRPKYYLSGGAEDNINKLLQTISSGRDYVKIIAIHPSGLRSEKKWKPERFAEVAKTMRDKGYIICLVGGEEDKRDSDNIIKELGNKKTFDFTGKLSLSETAALLSKSYFLLSNDTGIMHLATAVETPVIAIFGPTDYRHIGPSGEKAIVISKNNNIQDVLVSDVLDEIKRIERLKVKI